MLLCHYISKSWTPIGTGYQAESERRSHCASCASCASCANAACRSGGPCGGAAVEPVSGERGTSQPIRWRELGKPMKRWLWNFSKAHHLKPKSSVRCGYLPPSFYQNRNPPQMPWVFSRLTIQAIANPPLVYPAISSATRLWEPWVGPYLKNPRGLPSFSD